ncbi:MAG TPA: M48 family metallopeptidase [Longimicrobiaceae bacterium]|nr:M48 family metallopeptidase [Longimicrobiaceae bacterium]
MLRTVLVVLALAALPAAASAQVRTDTPPVAPASAVTAAPTTSYAAPATSADTGAVAVPPASEQALRYERSGNVLWVVDTLWALLLPLALLFTGLSARIRDLARRVGRKWYFTLAVYGALVSLVFWVVSLPLAYYEEFVREHAYGLSTQSAGKWFGDSVKALLVGMAAFALIMWVPYLLLRKSPRRWWLWTAAAAVPLLAVVFWVSPVVVDPLFNRFGPMHDRALEARILAEAERAGIEGSRVFEVDKSADTKALNAYVTGFGGSKRIVLWDTIIRKMDARELLFVLGHEMGHYVLRHVLMLMAAATLLILLALWAMHRSAGWALGRWSGRFGFSRLDDVASYPLLLVVVSLVSFAATPVFLAFSRHLEHEADRFGLELTRDNHAAATAFVKLQTENLATPYHSTLYKLWHDSHPPLGERIEFCNTYRPWAEGKPLRYGGHFR